MSKLSGIHFCGFRVGKDKLCTKTAGFKVTRAHIQSNTEPALL